MSYQMKCPQCGETSEKVLFCWKCGTAMERAEKLGFLRTVKKYNPTKILLTIAFVFIANEALYEVFDSCSLNETFSDISLYKNLVFIISAYFLWIVCKNNFQKINFHIKYLIALFLCALILNITPFYLRYPNPFCSQPMLTTINNVVRGHLFPWEIGNIAMRLMFIWFSGYLIEINFTLGYKYITIPILLNTFFDIFLFKIVSMHSFFSSLGIFNFLIIPSSDNDIDIVGILRYMPARAVMLFLILTLCCILIQVLTKKENLSLKR